MFTYLRILLFFAMVSLLAGVRAASACAVCAAGDPTLTVMGSERPFEGRMRGSADLRFGTASVGSGFDAIDLTEERLELGFAYFPTREIGLSVGLPGLVRQIDQPGAEVTRVSLGDVELRARDSVYSVRKGLYRHDISFFGGMKLPTAPLETDARGAYLPADLQPGCSSFVPFVGASYALLRPPWSLFASASLYTPIPIRDGPHTGDSLRSSLTLQAQPKNTVATRVGFSTRLDEPGEYAGVTDPNSGGFVGYVSAELVMSPKTDLLLTVGAFFPAIQVLRGEHREGTILQVGATFDF